MAEATETALVCIREEVERAFSSAPGAVLEAALSRIAPADECARAAAYAAWDSIAHPLGGMGDFEDAVARIAAAQGSAEVAEFPRALAVFFSDNGVVAEGVSQSGQDVTRAVARNMCEGATSACRMAAFAGAEVVPVDVGMARGIEDARMVRANVRRGSGNIAHGSAMSRDGAVRAIEV
ncbi:nicotinate-nucleotide--dimethylbenzimidazole phosphoribosyltransferase, partial [Collinsella aerofaciens]